MISLAKQGYCSTTNTIFSVAQIMYSKKTSMVLIINDNTFVGVITKSSISDAFANGATKTTKSNKIVEDFPVQYVDEKDPIPTQNGYYLVTKGRNQKITGLLDNHKRFSND